MPGLVPGIYVFKYTSKQRRDGWDEPGHDVMGLSKGTLV
jgi:hypothetical protein